MTVKWNSGTDLSSVIENVQTMTGQRGDGSGKVITQDQLVSLGLATRKTSVSGKTTLSPPTSFPGEPDTRVDYPTKPTGFVVESSFSFVVLIWDMPKYAGHSLTEIYRNADDNLANAVLVGTEAASVYSDSQNTGQTGYYYWIRHVNANGVPGAYNATAGTYGATDPNAAQNLVADRVVAGIEIDTPLINSARIQNGRFTVDENGNVVATNAVFNQMTANAGNFYDIIITRATIQNALIAANCTIEGILTAAQISGGIATSAAMDLTGITDPDGNATRTQNFYRTLYANPYVNRVLTVTGPLKIGASAIGPGSLTIEIFANNASIGAATIQTPYVNGNAISANGAFGASVSVPIGTQMDIRILVTKVQWGTMTAGPALLSACMDTGSDWSAQT
jgi:hypothetical protein